MTQFPRSPKLNSRNPFAPVTISFMNELPQNKITNSVKQKERKNKLSNAHLHNGNVDKKKNSVDFPNFSEGFHC
jgi:hypothetical protein